MNKSKYVRISYNPLDIAYLTGIIDGEGTIFIGNYGTKDKNRGTGFFQTILSVTSTDKILIEHLYKLFGGWKSEYTPKQRAVNCKGPVFSWKCTGDLMTHLCELMLPYSIINKNQLQIMIEFRKTYFCSEYQPGKKGVQRISEEIINKRLELMDKLKSLHCRNHTFNN